MQALSEHVQLVGNRLPFLSVLIQQTGSGARERGAEGGRLGEREVERESTRIYSMQAVGFCSQSHLDWEASFPSGEEWRQTDVATDDKKENMKGLRL